MERPRTQTFGARSQLLFLGILVPGYPARNSPQKSLRAAKRKFRAESSIFLSCRMGREAKTLIAGPFSLRFCSMGHINALAVGLHIQITLLGVLDILSFMKHQVGLAFGCK
jgi:hypothetical protein